MPDTVPENEAKDGNITTKSALFSKISPFGAMEKLPAFRFRWNTNEEVFTILTSMDRHENWVEDEVKIRPPNGSQLLYNRENIKTRAYHNDKYYWKTRKNCNSSRVDHSSLRIRGVECIYCSYVHSALVPTFHRRCYWLLENPAIVLVHYLNLPDKSTTNEHILSSLLPYKDMNDEELGNQLQPILSHSDDMQGNHKKVTSYDIKKLISDLKTSEAKPIPKSNPKLNARKVSPGNAKQVASAGTRQLAKSRSVTSQTMDKCSNCNRHFTIENVASKPPLNTVVAVTINKQTSRQRTRSSGSTGTRSPEAQNPENETPGVKCPGSPNPGTRNPRSAPRDLVTNFRTKDTNNNFISSTMSDNGYQDDTHLMTSHALAASQEAATRQQVPTTSHGMMTSPRSMTSLSLSTTQPPLMSRALTTSQHLVTAKSPMKSQSPMTSQQLMTSPSLTTSPIFLRSPVYFQHPTSSQPPVTSYLMMPMTSQSVMTSQSPVTRATTTPLMTSHPAATSLITSRPDPVTLHPVTSNMSLMTSHLTMTSQSPMMSQFPMTSHDVSKQNSDQLVLDYDGVDLIESASLENDAGKLLDMNLFENDLLQFLPGCISDDNCLDMRSPNADVTSQPFPSLPGHGTNNSLPDVLGTSSSFVDMIYADCHSPLAGSSEQPAPAVSKVLTSAVSTQTPNQASNEVTQHAVSISGKLEPKSRNVVTEHAQPSTSGGPGNQSKDRITEFSPEWSYPEGKTKVLILGQWSYEDGSYSCLFDGCCVLATLIQPGVLRCFCPAHDPGLVVLQVAWNGFIVSNACVFQYKPRESSPNLLQDWLNASDVDIKKSILTRIERLEAILEIGTVVGLRGTTGDTLEDRIVKICRVLMENQHDTSELNNSAKKLTLLHLAAALGFAKLIQLLQHCRSLLFPGTGAEEDDVTLCPWQPRCKDVFGCTPLMWACWRGHEEAALVLLSWQPSTYDDCDHSGRTAKTMALETGHAELVRKMEEFIRFQEKSSGANSVSSSSDDSPCIYPSLSSTDHEIPVSPMSDQSLTWEKVDSELHCEMDSIASEDRPNSLGKVLVEIRTLIQEAEQRARSPFQSSDQPTPFTVQFGNFTDLSSDEANDGHRSSHHDTISMGSSSPAHSSSSWSPGSPGVRNSPQSTSTDTSEFEEFLNKPRKFLERDFSELTLTDVEQQELLEAAKVIQNAYRQFKIRKKQHYDELTAAVLIQSYYRRYKQFALYKRITKAAVLIQNSYRAHKEHEQFKRHRHAAAVIQNYFRHYRKRKQRNGGEEDAPGKRMETKYRKPSYGK